MSENGGQIKTLKVSYTVLNAWSRGDIENAVAMYLGKGIPETPQLELGKAKHSLWEREIKRTGRMPVELGGEPLLSAKPQTETYRHLILPFSDEYRIRIGGVIDLWDAPRIVDFKCSKAPAGAHVSGLQLDIYKLFEPDATEGMIKAFNPITETHTTAVKFLDQHSVDTALNFIMTTAGELLQYLLAERLFFDYNPAKMPASQRQKEFLAKLNDEHNLGLDLSFKGLSQERAGQIIDEVLKTGQVPA